MAETYLALLRGINVGGKNLLPMRELREMFVRAGCRDVRTYIQSGNVIFAADADLAPALPDLITAQIAVQFGYRVPLVLRTAAQVAAVIQRNPFLAAGAAENTLHVLFLAGVPNAARINSLDPDRSPPRCIRRTWSGSLSASSQWRGANQADEQLFRREACHDEYREKLADREQTPRIDGGMKG